MSHLDAKECPVTHAIFIIQIDAVAIIDFNFITYAQGIKESVCLSVIVIVVVGRKIARSCVLGICACCKHNQLIEKVVCTHFKSLKKAY